jgi:hypothetical protein
LHKSVASVAWHRPSVTGGGIDGYEVLVIRDAPNGGGGAISIGSIGNDPLGASTTRTRFTKHHIKPGHRYGFAIAAVNGFGASGFTHLITVVHVIPPSPPRRVDALTGPHEILVRWRDAKHDGGAQVHYIVRYAAGCTPGAKGCKTRKLITGRFSADSVRIAHLKRHTTYKVQVLARNKKGASKPTKTVTATTQ